MPEPLTQRIRLHRLARSARRRVAFLYRDGGPDDQWCRIVMNERIAQRLREIQPATRSAIEISGRTHDHYGWASYTSSRYPELDICAPPKDLETYDVVICEQVLEHVADPWRTSQTLHDLCR